MFLIKGNSQQTSSSKKYLVSGLSAPCTKYPQDNSGTIHYSNCIETQLRRHSLPRNVQHMYYTQVVYSR